MSNLFEEFPNPSTSYYPNRFQQKYPCNHVTNNLESTCPNKPYEIIKDGKLVGYFWYYGDSIDLTFELSGTVTLLASDNYLTIQDIVDTLQFEANIYDFRRVKVLEYTNDGIGDNLLSVDTKAGLDNILITLHIDAETSAKLVKGVYKLDLVASHVSGYRETLFSKDSEVIFEVR